MKLGILQRALHVKKGEGSSVVWLLVLSLFQGVFIAGWVTVSNTAFLKDWDSVNLPYAYVTMGIFGLGMMRNFAYWEKRLPFTRLLTRSLMCLLTIVLLFTLVSNFVENRFLAFSLLVFTGPLLGILSLSFWGVAGRMFDLQQGKRLFGLISSGYVVANLVTFFLIAKLPERLRGTTDLLVLATVGLVGMLVIALQLVQRFDLTDGETETDTEEEPVITREEADPEPEEAPISHPQLYLFLVATAAFLAVFVQYGLDFALLIETDHAIPEENISAFLAMLFGAFSLGELIVKFALSGRLLKQFGVLIGLACVPAVVCLMMAITYMISNDAANIGVTGSVGDVISLATNTQNFSVFFVAIIVAKITEHVLHFAIFQTSFKILFQPLPKRLRFAAQTKVEGLVRQGGISVTGLFLLVLLWVNKSNPSRAIIPILILALVLWLITTWFLFKQYRVHLLERLKESRIRALLPTPVEVLASHMTKLNTLEKVYALNVLENVEPGLLEDYLAQYLDDLEMAEDALKRIDRLRLVNLAHKLQTMIADPQNPWRKKAEEVLANLIRLTMFKPEESELTRLAGSEHTKDRRMAARVVLRSDSNQKNRILHRLLWDQQASVKRLAILAVGESGNADFWPLLIDQMDSGIYCKAAGTALIRAGEAVFQDDVARNLFPGNPEAMVRLLKVITRIGGPTAKKFLLERITDPFMLVRLHALRGLSQLGYQVDEANEAQIKNRYRILTKRAGWMIGIRRDLTDTPGFERLVETLDHDLEQIMNGLHMLLALICDKQAVKLILDNLKGDNQARAFALEVAELVVPSDLRDHVLPVLEALDSDETFKALSALYTYQEKKPIDRMLTMLTEGPNSVNLWTRAITLETLGRQNLAKVPDPLVASVFHTSSLIRELAAFALRKIDRAVYKDVLKRVPDDHVKRLSRVIPPDAPSDGSEDGITTFGKVQALLKLPMFSMVPKLSLVHFANQVREVVLPEGTCLFQKGEPGETLYLVVSGVIRIHDGNRTITMLARDGVIGEIAVIETGFRTLSATADDASRLLAVDRHPLMDMLADHLEIIPDMIHMIARRRARA